jgi:hypothetical protein
MKFFILLLTLAFNASAVELYVNDKYPDMLLIADVIEYEDTNEIIKKLNLGNYSTVILDSPGGNLSAGMILGREFRKRNIKTIVTNGTMCASACAYAFMGGTERIIQLGAMYGLHRPYLTLGEEIKNASPLGLWNDGLMTAVTVINYLINMGMDKELAVLHLVDEDMQYYRGTDLKKYNIVT